MIDIETSFDSFGKFVNLYNTLIRLGLYETAEIVCIAIEENRQDMIALYWPKKL